MNLTIASALISIAIAGAGGFGAAWKIQAANITQIQLDQANERIAIQRVARATLERNMSRVNQAQAKAASRNRRLAADQRSAVTALDGLRTASASALRAATSGLDACTSTLATHSVVLGQCSGRYVEVARDADQLVSEVILYQDAWPK